MEVAKRALEDLDREYKGTYILHEMILDEEIERPMDKDEIVMDCVLEWCNWPEEDRKNNYLILKSVRKEFKESLKRAAPHMIFFEKGVDYSPNSVKTTARLRNKSEYKKHLVEVKHDRLTISKKVAAKGSRVWRRGSKLGEERKKSVTMMSLADASLNELGPSLPDDYSNVTYKVIKTWIVKDISWYYGTENKRKPESQHNITFILKDCEVERSWSTPYFGEAVSFPTREMCIDFVAALLVARVKRSIGGISNGYGNDVDELPYGIVPRSEEVDGDVHPELLTDLVCSPILEDKGEEVEQEDNEGQSPSGVVISYSFDNSEIIE